MKTQEFELCVKHIFRFWRVLLMDSLNPWFVSWWKSRDHWRREGRTEGDSSPLSTFLSKSPLNFSLFLKIRNNFVVTPQKWKKKLLRIFSNYPLYNNIPPDKELWFVTVITRSFIISSIVQYFYVAQDCKDIIDPRVYIFYIAKSHLKKLVNMAKWCPSSGGQDRVGWEKEPELKFWEQQIMYYKNDQHKWILCYLQNIPL